MKLFLVGRDCVLARAAAAAVVLFSSSQLARGQTGTALVRHAPALNGSVDGSVQQMRGENVTLNGGASVSGDLLVPGTPTVRLNGHPHYGGTLDLEGAAVPDHHRVTLNGGAHLRHVLRRADPRALPVVVAPPPPSGWRSVTVNNAGSSVGDWTTLRHLTLNGEVGNYNVPPGTYGNFVVNGGGSLTLGVSGATQPATYQLQRLTLNGQAELRVAGPVVLTLAQGFTVNGSMGASGEPSWLRLDVFSGGVTLNGGARLHGFVAAPDGSVVVNGNSQLVGGVSCDRLIVNGGGLLRLLEATGPEEAPTAEGQTLATDEELPVPIVLSGRDPEGAALTFALLSPPARGHLEGTAPELVYHPELDFAGIDSFSFTVSDGALTSAPATIVIAVANLNDAPVASGAATATDRNVPLPFTLEAADVDGDALTFTVTEGPQHGSLAGVPPSLIYSPDHDFAGQDGIAFIAGDASLASAPARVEITVRATNRSPIASPASLALAEDTTATVTLAVSDPDGDSLTCLITDPPRRGTLLAVEGSGPDFVYQPDANFHGEDAAAVLVQDPSGATCTAVVQITVSPVNDPPVAEARHEAASEDVALDLLLRASDVDGDPVGYVIVAPPLHGVLTGTPPQLTYTAAPDFFGRDGFEFAATDGALFSTPARVEVQVAPVNDLPVALPQSVEARANEAIAFLLAGQDADGDAMTFAITRIPLHGTLAGEGEHLTYTPQEGFVGTDELEFVASDGVAVSAPATVSIVVAEPVNRAPTVDAGADQLVSWSDVLSADLVVNGSAEAPLENGVIPGWTPVAGTAWTYQTGGERGCPAARDGTKCFFAGNEPVAELRQDVDVSDLAGLIDAGALPFEFRAHVRSRQELRPDVPTVVLEFRDAANATALASVSFSVGTPVAAWALLSDVQVALIGTRWIRIRLIAERSVSDASNDAFFDAISLRAMVPPGVSLAGAVADDGLPATGQLTCQWSQVGGPAAAGFQDAGGAVTAVELPLPGHYDFQLSASDGELLAADTVSIVVIGEGQNRAPAVDAGADRTILLPEAAMLLAAAIADDGGPGQLVLTWSQLAGPAAALFDDPFAASTRVCFRRSGEYRFRLSVSDGEFVVHDDLVATVSCPVAPVPLEVAIAIDHSASMSIGSKLDAAIKASKEFIRQINPFVDRVALFTFDTVEPHVGLTNDVPLLLAQVAGMSGQESDFGKGITYAQNHLDAVARPEAARIILIIADGQTDREPVIQAAAAARAKGSRIICFGIGEEADELLLRDAASSAADYYFVATAEDVKPAYASVAQTMCRYEGAVVSVHPGPPIDDASTTRPLDLRGSAFFTSVPPAAQTWAIWSMLSGPGPAEIVDAGMARAMVTFTTPGTYVFMLRGEASDGLVTAADEKMVTVKVDVRCRIEGPPGMTAWFDGEGQKWEAKSLREARRAGHFNVGAVGIGYVFQTDEDLWRWDPDARFEPASPTGWSLEFWMKIGNTPYDDGVLGWASGTHVFLDANTLHMQFVDAAGVGQDLGAGLPSREGWHHVAVTCASDGTALLYVDGVVLAWRSFGQFQPVTRGAFHLGSAPARPRLFQGGLDEVSLYNRALSTGEVQAIVAAGSAGKCPLDDNAPPVVDAGPDQTVSSVGQAVALEGVVVDDGRPRNATLLVAWSKVDGPGEVAFTPVSEANCSAVFTEPGLYILKLTADDGRNQAEDLVEVRVGDTCTYRADGSLLAWWTGNQATVDLVSARPLELWNGAACGPGRVAQAFWFDGRDDGATATVDLATGPEFTIEFWMNDGRNGWDDGILGWDNGTCLYADSDYVWAQFVDASGVTRLAPCHRQAAGTWHHYAVRYQADGTAHVFVDGAIQGGGTFGVFRPVTGGTLRLGSAPARLRRFKGAIDELSFYTRALSDAEIREIHASGANGKCPVVRNQPPELAVTVAGTPEVGQSLLLTATASDDGLPNPPGALSFAWSQVGGPGMATFSAPTAATTAVSFSTAGDYLLRVVTSDSELSVAADVTARIAQAPPPPPPPPFVEMIEPLDGATLVAGTQVILRARARSEGGFIERVEFFQGETKLGETTAPLVDEPATFGLQLDGGFSTGSHSLTARVWDNHGQLSTSPIVDVTVVDDPGIPPEVELCSPRHARQITQPMEATGVVSSPILASWELGYRRKGARQAPGSAWRRVSQGTTNVGTPASGMTPAIPGVLGVFDPTRLLNGIYELQLSATDLAGRTTRDEAIAVVVDGRLKFGHVNEAAVDVSIPAPGLPLEILRRYDSRDDRRGDFGLGGSLASSDFRLEKDMPLGGQWFSWSDTSGPAGFPRYHLQPSPPESATGVPPAPRLVTITLPGDAVFRFSAHLQPDNQVGAPIAAGRLVFAALPGTVGSLEPLDDTFATDDQVLVAGPGLGEVDLHNYTHAEIYDPSIFRLTTADGNEFIIDELLGLIRQTDPLGNWIEYRTERIVHSNGMELLLERDAQGCITAVRDPAGNSMEYAYDVEKRLIGVTDRAGRTTSFAYAAGTSLVTSVTPPAALSPSFNVWDGLDRLIARVDATGNEWKAGYDLPNYTETRTDPLGQITTYTMDGMGRLRVMTDPLGGVTSYAYEDPVHPFLQTSITDPLGRTTAYTFNAAGQPAVICDPLGHTRRFEYHALGLVTREEDEAGHAILRSYDAAGCLLAETARDGAVTRHTYDTAGNRLTTTDPLGGTTSWSYNSQGLPVTEVLATADGTVVVSRSFDYDVYGNLTRDSVRQVRDDGPAQEVVTTNLYDAMGNPLATTFPNGLSETRVYDEHGRLAQVTDGWGAQTGYTYDAAGRRTSVGYQDGSSETTTYDARGRVLATTDRDGNTTSRTYDALDRLVKVVLPDGAEFSSTYDAAGQVLAETDAEGRTTSFAYDLGGRPTRIVHPDGNTTTVVHDAVGNVTAVSPRYFAESPAVVQGQASGPMALKAAHHVRPMGGPSPLDETRERLIELEYDVMRRVTAIRKPDGTVASITYDSLGRPVATTNELGASWQFSYADSRVVSRARVSGPEGYSEEFTVDALANLTRQVDALGRITQARFSGFDQTSTTYPDATSESFEYVEGRLARLTDRRGHVTDLTYTGTPGNDGYTRKSTRRVSIVGVDSVETSESEQTISEVYDRRQNVRLVLESVDGGSRLTTHQYDFANRRVRTTRPDGSTVGIEYAPGGDIARVIETDGGVTRTTSFAYDVNGHVSKITFPDGAVNTFTHAPDGRPLTSTNARGGVTRYTYDDVAHTTAITDPMGGTTTRRFDALGNLLSVTDANGHTTSYTYDALGRRLTERNALGEVATTTYDLAGNVLTVTDALGRVTSFADYDANDRPATATVRGLDGSATVTNHYDAAGNLIRAIDPLGREATFVYDELSRLIRSTSARGLVRATRWDNLGNPVAIHAQPLGAPSQIRTLHQEHDRAGNLLQRRFPDGGSEGFTYTGFGRVAAHTNPRGFATLYGYDGVSDRIASVTLPNGGVRTFGYDAMGNMISETDARGTSTAREFDALQRLTALTTGGERTTSFTHDAVGNVLTVTRPGGQRTTTTYDALDRPVTASTELSGTDSYERSFGYDRGGRLVTVTDDNGSTLFEYDFQDNRTRLVDALGGISSWAYNPAGDLVSATDPLGNTTLHAYTAGGQLQWTTDAEGQAQRFEFNAFDELTRHTIHGSAAEEFVTDFVHDPMGRLLQTTRQGPSGGLSTFATYDAGGLVTSRTDEAGYATVFDHDAGGRVRSVTAPDGSTRSFAYDAGDALVDETDELGRRRSYERNAFGEVIAAIDPLGGTTRYTRDGEGRITAVSDATGRITRYTYDLGGRMTAIARALGTESRSHDRFGNLLDVTDADGRKTSFAYDALGRLTRASRTVGVDQTARAGYQYDAGGNLTAILDSLDRVTSFGYDRVNRRTSMTLPGAGQAHVRLGYDARNLLTSRTDAAGRVTRFRHDSHGRMLAIEPPAELGPPAIHFGYDPRGLCTSMTDALGTTVFSYDDRRRLTSKSTPYAGRADYGYDRAGNLTSLRASLPGGLSHSYSHDAADRLEAMTVTGGSLTHGLTTHYSRDAAGRLTALEHPDGRRETFTHDADGRISAVATIGPAGSSRSFEATRTPAGRLLRVDERGFGFSERSVAYEYDEGARLVAETALGAGPAGSLTYTLDAEGNRLARHGSLGGLAAQTLAYDQQGRLDGVAYDANGNVAGAHPGAPAGLFGYDFRDALTRREPALQPPAPVVEFIVDGTGARVGKRVYDALAGRWRTTFFLIADANPTGEPQVLTEVVEHSAQRSFALGARREAQHTFAETSITGGGHNLALDADGRVWAWGDNTSGQAGTGLVGGSLEAPVQLAGLPPIAFVAAGRSHSVALGADGTVWTWGAGVRGQTGCGSASEAGSPTRVPGLDDIVAIATHLDHTLALSVDGRVWAWGANERGQLGDGTTEDRFVPVLVPGLVATEIAAGQVHSLALAADGRVYAWGDHTHGQLARAGVSGGFSSTPAVAEGLVGVENISAGGFHNVVRRVDGSVWSWGGNRFGQLGDGSHDNRSVPVEVVLAAGASEVAAGARHTLALMGDGTLRAWGDNRYGQLGVSGVGEAMTPLTVSGVFGAARIAAGGRRSLVRTADGTVLGWGEGGFSPAVAASGFAAVSIGGEAGLDPLDYNLGFQQASYGYDTQGHVRFLTDGAGTLTDAYTYDAFGNLIARSGTTDNPYLFQGERFEAEAGLYHLRARDYDPALGRFQQLDEFEGFAGQPGSHNRYVFAEADPVNLRDPSGRYAVSVAGAMYLLHEHEQYLATLASIGPSEQSLSIEDWLVDPMKSALGMRPGVVNRERLLSLQATGAGALLGSIEQEAGATGWAGGKTGRGADGDVYFHHKTGARFRRSVVERMVESAWGGTRRLWPQLNTGARYATDPLYGRSLRSENRWSDVIYHDALLQSAWRAHVVPLLEVQARFTRTLGDRRYAASSMHSSTRALMHLHLADGGLRTWTAPLAAGAGDVFLERARGEQREWTQADLIDEWTDAALGSAAYEYALSWARSVPGAAGYEFFHNVEAGGGGGGLALWGGLLATVPGVQGIYQAAGYDMLEGGQVTGSARLMGAVEVVASAAGMGTLARPTAAAAGRLARHFGTGARAAGRSALDLRRLAGRALRGGVQDLAAFGRGYQRGAHQLGIVPPSPTRAGWDELVRSRLARRSSIGYPEAQATHHDAILRTGGAAERGLGRVTGSFDAFNPGSLSDDLAGTFSGGRYREVILEADTVLYRAGAADRPLGQFFDLAPPQGITQARMDKAILPRWPGGGTSPIDSAIGVRIPKGTKVYVGEVSSQGGVFVGGTQQIVVPNSWKIPGVKVESIAPIR